MKRAHHATFYIGYQHRYTIGGLDTEQQTRSAGDHAVARWGMSQWGVDAVDDRRMNLVDLHERPRAAAVAHRADSLLKQFAIALDIGVRVGRGESPVQRLA